MTFPASATFGQLHSEGTGKPTFVYRDGGSGTGVWQNVGMGYGYLPVPFTATPGQTVITVAYQVGAVDIYVEGARLLDFEFSATNGTSITVADPFVGGERGIVIPHSVLSTLQGLRKDLNLGDLASVDAALTNMGFSAIGKTLRAVADAAAGRVAIGAGPLPQAAAGVGQFLALNSTGGGSLVLPAGGTWIWWRVPKDTGTSAWGGGASGGVDAGGATIASATAGIQWHGWALRIS